MSVKTHIFPNGLKLVYEKSPGNIPVTQIQAFCNLHGCTVVTHDAYESGPDHIGAALTLARPTDPLSRVRLFEPLGINEILLLTTNRQLEGKIFHLFRGGEHYDTLKFNNSDTTKTFG